MDEEDKFDFDEDVEMLKYELELGQIDEKEYKIQLAKLKQKNAPAPKGGQKKKKDDDDVDVDALMAAMEANGGELPDSDDEKAKPVATQNIKVAPPQSKPTSQVQQKPVAPMQKTATAPKQANPAPVTQTQGGNADPDDDILAEEENKYHKHMEILSVSALNDEIENYFPKVLDAKKIGGEDYRDLLEMVKDEWQGFVEKVSGQMQSGKLTMERYCEMAKQGLTNQQQLLELAQKKKTTLNTIDRIKHRIKIIQGEIDEISKMGQEQNEEHMQEEKIEKPGPAPVPEVKNSAPGPKTSAMQDPKHKKTEESAAPHKTESKLKPDHESASIPEKKTMDREYLVPKEKLERLSDRINQYIFLAKYWHSNEIEPKKELLIKVAEAKKLFKDPYSITSGQLAKWSEELPEIDVKTLLGMDPEERDAKIDQTLEEALESFEQMKAAGCSTQEAESTANTIKYLRKIKDVKTVRFPEISTKDLEKQMPSKSNQTVPDDSIRLTFLKLSGSADHRVFFLRYTFEYGGKITTGETPYVGLCNTSIMETENLIMQ